MTKYGARRTWSNLCQREFDSKAECIRGEELRLLETAGKIKWLEYQTRFVLSEKPKVTITIDFNYVDWEQWVDSDGIAVHPEVYEDVKGVLTRDFRTKLAWLKQLHNIDVQLIR